MEKDKPRFKTLLRISENLELISYNPRPKFQAIPFFTYTISNSILLCYIYFLFNQFPFFFKILQLIIYLSFVISFPFLAFLNPGFRKRTDEEAKAYAELKDIHPLNRLRCFECLTYYGESIYHCPDCDICVEEFDHHCDVVGNCIGGKNQLCFEIFIGVVVTNIICAFVGLMIVVSSI